MFPANLLASILNKNPSLIKKEGAHHANTHLRNEVKVGNQSRLQDDGDVGGIKELDWIGSLLSTVTSALNRKIHTETLRQSNVSIT